MIASMLMDSYMAEPCCMLYLCKECIETVLTSRWANIHSLVIEFRKK